MATLMNCLEANGLDVVTAELCPVLEVFAGSLLIQVPSQCSYYWNDTGTGNIPKEFEVTPNSLGPGALILMITF